MPLWLLLRGLLVHEQLVKRMPACSPAFRLNKIENTIALRPALYDCSGSTQLLVRLEEIACSRCVVRFAVQESICQRWTGR